MEKQKRDNLDNLIRRSYDKQLAETPPSWESLFGEDNIGLPSVLPIKKRGISLKLIASLAAAVAVVVVVALTNSHKDSFEIEQLKDSHFENIAEISDLEVNIDTVEDDVNGTLFDNKDEIKQKLVALESGVTATLNSDKKENKQDIIEQKIEQNSGLKSEKRGDEEKVVEEREMGSIRETSSHQPIFYNEEQFSVQNIKKFRLIASSSLGAAGKSTSINSSFARSYNSPAIALSCFNISNAVNFYPDQYRHKMPVNATIQLAYSLTDNLWLSGGVSFSLLESTAQSHEKNSYHLDQQVKYIGVPIAFNYDIVSFNSISLYSALTLSPEWILSQKQTISLYQGDKKISSDIYRDRSNKAMLYSSLGFGGRWNIIDRLSLFVEPNIAVSFFDGLHPITIRNSSKVNFNFNAGLQINL